MGLREVQELLHAQVDIAGPSHPLPQDPLATPSYGLQPLPPCALACTPLGSSANDLYTVANAPLLTRAVDAWDQHLRAASMRLHMGRLDVWCPAGQNALPPALREHCTPKLPVRHHREKSGELGTMRHRLFR